MEAAQHGEGRFTVQLADVPIIVFKNKLAGEKHAVRKVRTNSFHEVCELFDGINAERHIRSRRKAAVVAIRDKESQRPFRLLHATTEVGLDSNDASVAICLFLVENSLIRVWKFPVSFPVGCVGNSDASF
jgi:hypothetical protein